MAFKFGDVVRWKLDCIKDRTDRRELVRERLMLIYPENEYTVEHPIWYALPLDEHSRSSRHLVEGIWSRAGEPYIELDEES